MTYAFSDVDSAHLFRPNHFRLIPNERYLAVAVVAVIEKYLWKRVVLLSQSLPVFSMVHVDYLFVACDYYNYWFQISSHINIYLNASITNMKFSQTLSFVSHSFT